MHRIPVLHWPDIQPAGYPANLKAGCLISGRISGKGGYQISGRIFCSKFKRLLKYDMWRKGDMKKKMCWW
jgi:hypothetical protein